MSGTVRLDPPVDDSMGLYTILYYLVGGLEHLGKFDHDRSLFSRALESMGFFKGNHPLLWALINSGE